MNNDEERELSTAFGLTSLPTLLFIPIDEMPQVARDALPKKEPKKAINFLIK